jgi:hypothetical protein
MKVLAASLRVGFCDEWNRAFKPVFHSRISPPLAKNLATEKVHLLFFRTVNKRSNRS